MTCGGCGEKNRDGARFCLFCGTALAARCSVCDNELPSGARFCDSCGTPVDEGREPAAAARKVVTVLFVDLTGSTALEEKLDAESVRSILDRFYATLRTETERFGGRVVKFTGDGIMAVFGVPDVREDDASRAVDAALAMQTECAHLSNDLGLELAIKIGVNTGEVVVSETDEDVVGDCVNVAARLEGAATSGEVLVGEETWRLTRATSRYATVAPLTLKGKSEPVPAYRLLAVDERTADSAAAPFVGRDAELGRLLAAFQDGVDTGSARLVTIIGAPGLGKTRLARELMSELEGQARVRETRCDPADSSTFAPIADALRGAAGITEAADESEVVDALAALIPPDDPDRDRIATRAAAILGAGVAGSTEETFWALRRIIETAAQAEPVVLVMDDIHWAEPLLLDLIEHLAEWIDDAPVLIVGTARPELRDIRPSLTEGGRLAAVVALEGLDESATARLALNLLGTEELPDELLKKIPASTEGNPLFVRELVRMLVDDGVLLRTGDGWTVTLDVDAIQVPPTIHALLAARVDRLRNDERTFIELAAVVGKEFYRGALHELAPAAIRDQLDGCLESLRRKELVEPAGSYWIDEPVYRFHHVLIRDAAYRRLLKESRAELHERVAAWLEAKTQDVLGEHDELIGYHLEQAHEYKAQLGRDDDELAGRASRLLGSAAIRSLDRDDLPAAASLSGRALARLPRDDTSRAEFLLVRCEALLSIGDVAAGAEAVAELERVAEGVRLSAWARCFAGQLANLTSPERLEETEKRVAAAAAQLAELGDPAGAAKGHTVHAATLAGLGRFAECERVLDSGLTAARAANDRRRITAVLGSAPHAALWGPSPVSRAGGRCLDIVRLLRITTGSPAVEATSLRCQAVLEAFRGRADAARRMLSSARRTLTELGLQHELLEAEQFAGIVELAAGDPSAAITHLSTAYEGFRSVGVEVLAARSAALLARSHLLLDELDDATRFADESELLGGQDLKASIAWRSVRAEVLARHGHFDEAKRLAEAAVEIASRTDALIDHADACSALAAVCEASGDEEGARSAADRAASLYERKGATALMATSAPATAPPPPPEPPARLENVSTSAVAALDTLYRSLIDRDWGALRTILDDETRFEDRRRGFGNVVEGVEPAVELNKALTDVGLAAIDTNVLTTRGDRLVLAHAVFKGTEDAGVEVEILQLIEVDDAGAILAALAFDPADVAAATAELDARFHAAPVEPRPNDAARAIDRRIDDFLAGDLDGYIDQLAPDVRFEDRRHGLQAGFDGRDVALEVLDGIRSIGVDSADAWLLATRGARLALHRVVVRGARYDTELFNLDELDEAGRIKTLLAFDPDDLDGAFDELDRMYIDGEGAGQTSFHVLSEMLEAHRERDWGRARNAIADDFVLIDHRPAGLGRQGADEYIQGVAGLTEVVPDLRIRCVAVHAVRPVGGVFEIHASGTNAVDGGIELRFLMVASIRDGLGNYAEYFPIDALDAALKRFEELADRRPRLENDAVRAYLDAYAAASRGDEDWATRYFEADVVHDDRRRGLTWEFSGEPMYEHAQRSAASEEETTTVIAVRGRRLALIRQLTRSPEGWEVEAITVVGLGSEGRIAHVITFDPDDLDGAFAELDDRYIEGEGAPFAKLLRNASAQREAMVRGDFEAYRDFMGLDVVLIDHRPTSLGSLEGIDEVVAAVQGVSPLIRDLAMRVVAYHAIDVDRSLIELLATGSAEHGGTVEVATLRLQHVRDGRVHRIELFGVDEREAALARFDELGRSTALWNRCVAAVTSLAAAFEAADWERYRGLVSPQAIIEDRRLGLHSRITGIEGFVAASQAIVDVGGTRTRIDFLATRGDRLGLSRNTFFAGDTDDVFEVTVLLVHEIDDDGLYMAQITFDPDDLDAAFDVLDDRYIEGEGAQYAELFGALRAVLALFNSHDWEAIRARFEDAVVVDHRPASFGEASGIDALIVGADLVRDIRFRPTEIPLIERTVALARFHVVGTTHDGATLDWPLYLLIGLGETFHAELFGIDQLEAAERRFAEIRDDGI